jgi:hypothetical protein
MPVQSVVTLPEGIQEEKLTFGELTRIGAVSFCEKEAVDEKTVAAVAIALEQLAVGEDDGVEGEEASGEFMLISPAVRPQVTMERPDVPVYGSIESEKRITEGFERLRGSKRFDEIRSVRVEDYWDRSVISAPFIESLRFDELVTLRVDDILKKRSFGNAKVHGLLCCLDRCLNSLEVDGDPLSLPIPAHAQTVEKEETPAIQNECSQEPSSPVSRVECEKVADGTEGGEKDISLSSSEHHLPDTPLLQRLAGAGLQALIDKESGSVVAEFFSCLLDHANVDRILALCCDENTVPTEEELQVVREFFQGLSPTGSTVLRTTLLAPAVEESGIAQLVFGQGANEFLVESAMRILPFAIGARLVEIWGRTLSGYWSSSPQAAEMIFEGIYQRLPLADEVVQRELRTLLPQIEIGLLLEIFSLRAVCRDEDSSWHSRQS